jgi:hypothetical protein
MRNTLLAFAALAAFGAADASYAQNATDEAQVLISQIQTDKRAVVLATLQLTDAQVAEFTPIYDEYQGKMKQLMIRGSEVLNKFASNYGSMTDDAAKDILKESFKIRRERIEIIEDYAKKLERKLPATKVLQWVQVENKLNTLLDMQAAAVIPIAQ